MSNKVRSITDCRRMRKTGAHENLSLTLFLELEIDKSKFLLNQMTSSWFEVFQINRRDSSSNRLISTSSSLWSV